MTEKSWLFEFISSEADRYKRAILAYEREAKKKKGSPEAVIYSARIDEAKINLEEMYDVLEYMEKRKNKII